MNELHHKCFSVGIVYHPYISKILQISFPQIIFFILFTLTNACLPCQLRKAFALLWVANRFVSLQIPKHNAFDLINENFKSLNSISNIFQETLYFLVLTDSIITCIYF